MKVRNIIDYIEQDFPTELAYEWDNVGLQVGSDQTTVTKILVTLDVTIEVIKEAVTEGVNMIVAHHPMIFRPIKQINTDHVTGQMIKQLIKHDIALYIMHTNYDISNKGMNQLLADKLSLENQQIVDFTTEDEGLGRIGTVKQTTLDKFAKHVQKVFHVDTVRVVGSLDEKIETVAIVGGSGTSVIDKALKLGADVLVTGDITYHHALDMNQAGLLGIDPGHHIEVAFVDALQEKLDAFDKNIAVIKSNVNTNPYKTIN